MPTKGYRTSAERAEAGYPARAVHPVFAAAAAAIDRFPQSRTLCPKCGTESINTTCPKCVVRTKAAPQCNFGLGACTCALGSGEGPCKLSPRVPERPNQMSFAEQFIEALNEHIDARTSYNETRRGRNAEWANPDDMNKTEARLQALVEKVRFAL